MGPILESHLGRPAGANSMNFSDELFSGHILCNMAHLLLKTVLGQAAKTRRVTCQNFARGRFY